jgi:hypothetical protein
MPQGVNGLNVSGADQARPDAECVGRQRRSAPWRDVA